MRRASVVIGILAFVVGFGLIAVAAANNGGQECGTGGVGRGGTVNPAAPCSSLTLPLTIAGVIVVIAGLAAALVISRVATRHR
jgi:hypothetical protein